MDCRFDEEVGEFGPNHDPKVEKLDPTLAKIQRDHPDARTVGDLAWAALESLGAEERRRDPRLTQEGAVAKALQTPEGAALYPWTRPPWRDLGLAEAVAKAESRQWLANQGYVNWSHVVAELAQMFSPDNPVAGMAKVKKRCPTVWKTYRAERCE